MQSSQLENEHYHTQKLSNQTRQTKLSKNYNILARNFTFIYQNVTTIN